MRRRFVLFLITIIILFIPLSASADNLFVDYGLGFLASSGSQFFEVRYRHETSTLFNRPGSWQAIVDYWNGSNTAGGLAVAREIRWSAGNARTFSFSLGGMVLNHSTRHLGTNLQFHVRFAYNIRVAGSDVQLAFTHISNGKLIFQWDGPNTGENFLCLSVGFL